MPLKIRLKASAGFVSASALGMACGPGLAGLLQTEFKIYGVTFNQNTLPGWVMCIAWVVNLIWLWISFKEPDHIARANAANTQSADSGKLTPLIYRYKQIFTLFFSTEFISNSCHVHKTYFLGAIVKLIICHIRPSPK